MYARLILTPFGTITPDQANTASTRIDALLKPLPGCTQVLWLLDEASGEYGSVSLWETQADAEAGWAAIGEKVMGVLSSCGLSAKQALQPRSFTVCEPTPGSLPA